MKSSFIESSYVVTHIFQVKKKYFNEYFVTLEEYHTVIKFLQQKLDYGIITDKIDRNYFDVLTDIIVLQKGIDLIDIESIFIIPDLNQERIISDEKFIKSIIENIRNSKTVVLSDLEKIIDKVLDEPKLFFEKISHELSKEEYYFISTKLKETKTCNNCTNINCSNSQKLENDICDNWNNDELIGKAKVLLKF